MDVTVIQRRRLAWVFRFVAACALSLLLAPPVEAACDTVITSSPPKTADLEHYDVNASNRTTYQPFGSGGSITALAADAYVGSVWVAGGTQAKELNASGSQIGSFSRASSISGILLTRWLNYPTSLATKVGAGARVGLIDSAWQIADVFLGSGAEQGDIQPGDKLISVNAQAVPATNASATTISNWLAAVGAARSGSSDSYVIERSGVQHTKTATVGTFEIARREHVRRSLGVVEYAITVTIRHEKGKKGEGCSDCNSTSASKLSLCRRTGQTVMREPSRARPRAVRRAISSIPSCGASMIQAAAGLLFLAATATGTVAIDGRPVEGVQVYAIPLFKRTPSDLPLSTTTGKEGVFRIDGLSSKRSWVIAAVAENRAETVRFHGDPMTIEIPTSRSLLGKILALEERAYLNVYRPTAAEVGSVAWALGEIASSNGDSIAVITLDISPPGDFRIDGLSPGTYRIEVSTKTKSGLIDVDVGGSTTNVAVPLEPFGTVTGKVVVDPSLPRLPAMFKVRVRSVERDVTHHYLVRDSHFVARPLMPGKYLICIEFVGGARTDERSIEVLGGSQAFDFAVTAPPVLPTVHGQRR